MAKTRRLLAENLKLVDVVIELLDARIPSSSKNPEIDSIINNKSRLVVLNKTDLADPEVSKEWSAWYKKRGIPVIFADSIKGKGLNILKDSLKSAMQERFDRDREKGRIFRTVKTMVVGIPNVGKSTFINKIAGKAVAMTGDKPGVTRGKQWIRLNPEIDMLDTPGILWPKFDDQETALNLAFTGAIKDDIMDITEVAAALAERLSASYPQLFLNRYKLEQASGMTGLELVEAAGKKRGCILPGGIIDMQRISTIILDEFRGGKIGTISLERPMKGEAQGNGTENGNEPGRKETGREA